MASRDDDVACLALPEEPLLVPEPSQDVAPDPPPAITCHTSGALLLPVKGRLGSAWTAAAAETSKRLTAETSKRLMGSRSSSSSGHDLFADDDDQDESFLYEIATMEDPGLRRTGSHQSLGSQWKLIRTGSGSSLGVGTILPRGLKRTVSAGRALRNMTELLETSHKSTKNATFDDSSNKDRHLTDRLNEGLHSFMSKAHLPQLKTPQLPHLPQIFSSKPKDSCEIPHQNTAKDCVDQDLTGTAAMKDASQQSMTGDTSSRRRTRTRVRRRDRVQRTTTAGSSKSKSEEGSRARRRQFKEQVFKEESSRSERVVKEESVRADRTTGGPSSSSRHARTTAISDAIIEAPDPAKASGTTAKPRGSAHRRKVSPMRFKQKRNVDPRLGEAFEWSAPEPEVTQGMDQETVSVSESRMHTTKDVKPVKKGGGEKVKDDAKALKAGRGEKATTKKRDSKKAQKRREGTDRPRKGDIVRERSKDAISLASIKANKCTTSKRASDSTSSTGALTLEEDESSKTLPSLMEVGTQPVAKDSADVEAKLMAKEPKLYVPQELLNLETTGATMDAPEKEIPFDPAQEIQFSPDPAVSGEDPGIHYDQICNKPEEALEDTPAIFPIGSNHNVDDSSFEWQKMQATDKDDKSDNSSVIAIHRRSTADLMLAVELSGAANLLSGTTNQSSIIPDEFVCFERGVQKQMSGLSADMDPAIKDFEFERGASWKEELQKVTVSDSQEAIKSADEETPTAHTRRGRSKSTRKRSVQDSSSTLNASSKINDSSRLQASSRKRESRRSTRSSRTRRDSHKEIDHHQPRDKKRCTSTSQRQKHSPREQSTHLEHFDKSYSHNRHASCLDKEQSHRDSSSRRHHAGSRRRSSSRAKDSSVRRTSSRATDSSVQDHSRRSSRRDDSHRKEQSSRGDRVSSRRGDARTRDRSESNRKERSSRRDHDMGNRMEHSSRRQRDQSISKSNRNGSRSNRELTTKKSVPEKHNWSKKDEKDHADGNYRSLRGEKTRI